MILTITGSAQTHRPLPIVLGSYSETHFTRLDIKGPSLHHELNVLRVWTCPACGTVTRTGGEVTSRKCDCNDRPQMQYSDAPVPAPADVSSFVTYMTPEFEQDDDDGTDLPLPDIDSLVTTNKRESNRGRSGTPLRDTLLEAPSDHEQLMSDRGPGFDRLEKGSETLSETPTAGMDSPSPDGQQEPEKRRRGRRRRRGGRSGGSRASDHKTSHRQAEQDPGHSQSDIVSSDGQGVTQTEQSDLDSGGGDNTVKAQIQGKDEGEQKSGGRKRRRRRRGPRKKTRTASSEGSDGTGPNSKGDSDS